MDDCRLRIADCKLQIVLLVLICSMTAGCARKVATAYGQRKGAATAQRKGAATYSVNGTRVLGEMFEAAGHDVYSWRWLSPRVRGFQL